jgi:putative sigma-54 modulation protein
MRVNVQSVHFDADKKLIDYIESKLEKLTLFFDEIVDAEVILKLEKDTNLENKVAEIKLGIKGNDLFAKRSHKTFEQAADEVVEALRSQIIKHKEKVKQL